MIIDRKNAASFCEELKLNGKQIVFTNGCFDIIHAGHVRYLSRQKFPTSRRELQFANSAPAPSARLN